MKEKTIFKGLFVLAMLIIAFLYVFLPNYVRQATLQEEGRQYVPLTRESHFDHMNVHAGRYRDIIDGSFLSGEVDTWEHRDGPSIWPLLSAAIFAPFLWITGSVFTTILVTDFIFPLITFSLFFLIINTLIRSRYFALFSSFVLMLFPGLPLYLPPVNIVELKVLILQFLPPPLGIGHPGFKFLLRESMIPGSVFFIGTLLLAYKAIDADKKRKLFIFLGGIFYGLLFYLYFFFWVFATIFLGLLFLVFLFQKKKKEAVRLFTLGSIGLVVSIPFWINFLAIQMLPNADELIGRNGVEVGHAFRFWQWLTYLVYIGMASAIIFLGTKLNKKKEVTFLSVLALVSIIVLNIQVLTGFNVQSDHWNSRVFVLTHGIIWPVIFYWSYLLLKDHLKIKWFSKVVFILLFVGSLSLVSNVISTNIKHEKQKAHRYTISPDFVLAYEWLNENTQKDSVVMSPSQETNIDLAVYTHNRLFMARPYNSLASEEEILDRLYSTYTLLNIDSSHIYNLLVNIHGIVNTLGETYRGGGPDRYLDQVGYRVPDVVIARILNDYISYELPNPLSYRLDYIFIGPREYALGLDKRVLDRYKKVYEAHSVTIYEVPQVTE